jgi:hypothetical protein
MNAKSPSCASQSCSINVHPDGFLSQDWAIPLRLLLGYVVAFAKVTAIPLTACFCSDRSDSFAETIQNLLWPSTGKSFLSFLRYAADQNEDPNFVEKNLERLGKHFGKYVRGSGPLPLIRIADQPYGILPVSQTHKWVVSELDHSDDGSDMGSEVLFDELLHSALMKLYDL